MILLHRSSKYKAWLTFKIVTVARALPFPQLQESPFGLHEKTTAWQTPQWCALISSMFSTTFHRSLCLISNLRSPLWSYKCHESPQWASRAEVNPVGRAGRSRLGFCDVAAIRRLHIETASALHSSTLTRTTAMQHIARLLAVFLVALLGAFAQQQLEEVLRFMVAISSVSVQVIRVARKATRRSIKISLVRAWSR